MLQSDDKKLEQAANKQQNDIVDNEKTVDQTNKTETESIKVQESESSTKTQSIPIQNYQDMDLEKLVEQFKKLLSKYPVQQVKNHIEIIKTTFNSKFGKLLAAKKAAFLAQGGNSIDFQFSSPVKTSYNKLLFEYKQKRDAYYNKLEKQLKENLEKRNALIQELKKLIEQGDTDTIYREFKEIQKKWKLIGSVPKTKYNNIWKTYHHHVERFYSLLHLNKDLRELDFKHNFEEKLRLVELAESLDKKSDINEAFKELQELHRLWKEETGPVAIEHREMIWDRFSRATKKIHDKRHFQFKELKQKHQNLIDEKFKIIEQISNYDTSKNKTHKDWKNSLTHIEALKQKYLNIGKLPHIKNEAAWGKFKIALKDFTSKRNAFYKEEKDIQSSNLKKKIELVDLAESLKDSQDWEQTTSVMKQIQSDWKKIGYIPKKQAELLWVRFKDACNYYFDRYHKYKNNFNEDQIEIIKNKKDFFEKVKNQKNISIEQAKEFMNKWKELGSLPRELRHLNEKFNNLLGHHLKKLDLSNIEIELLKFKNIINDYIAQKNYQKIDDEKYFIKRKIEENVREMQQLENNLSFISNAKSDNPLVVKVIKEVQQYKNSLDILQAKLSYLKRIKL
ncbi:MAG: DUF349 domain-containing protein [Tenacibaculum sp.]